MTNTRLPLRISVILIAIGASGCCDSPLPQACEGDCPTYSRSLAACEWDGSFNRDDLRVLSYGGANGGRFEYYSDESLISVQRWSDTGFCWNGPRITDCELVEISSREEGCPEDG